MSVDSEALLAATGFIDPEITPAKLERAAGVPVRLAERVRAWMMGSGRQTWAPTKTQNAEKLRDKLSIEVAEAPGQEALPELVAAEWLLEVNEARHSVLEQWPALSLIGGLDTTEPPLAFDRKQDWLSLVASVEDPFRFLADLELGAALKLHVDVVRENYPELSDLITAAMFATITELAEKKRDLPPGKDASVRLWLGLEESVPLAKAEEQLAEAESPAPTTSKVTEETKTQAQKAGM
jgi:hypothetical protein